MNNSKLPDAARDVSSISVLRLPCEFAGSSYDGETGPSFSDLRQSILTNGGIIHPIIVNKDAAGQLVVIEGNTRTLIYREFDRLRQKGTWDTIPALLYENMGAETIESIRLQAHLVGARPWDPYSKAKYLDYLRNIQHLTFAQIIDFCGGNRREVENYIQAYQDMEGYYRPLLDSDQDFDHTRFSAFVELQAGRITDALLSHDYTKADFAKWVHDRRLHPLNTVRHIPRILQNARSHEVFLKEGAQEAMRVLDVPSVGVPLAEATLEQLARALCRRITSLEYGDMLRLRGETGSEEKDVLFDAKDAIVGLCEDIASSSNT
ncbi:MAG: hypothetical protein GXY19_11200 [Phycisphaerae bacterium]|nr:hypothetical protein [Phycisphaerae bacterium]